MYRFYGHPPVDGNQSAVGVEYDAYVYTYRYRRGAPREVRLEKETLPQMQAGVPTSRIGRHRNSYVSHADRRRHANDRPSGYR